MNGMVWTEETWHPRPLPPSEARGDKAGAQHAAPLLGRLEPAPGTEYEVTFMAAGEVQGHGLWLAAEVLEDAVPLFHGRSAFLDHPDLFDRTHRLSALLGVTRDPLWNAAQQRVDGVLRLAQTPAADLFRRLMAQILEDRARGLEVPDVGLSAHVLWMVDWDKPSPPSPSPALSVAKDQGEGGRGMRGLFPVKRILDIISIDAVFRPAAGGAIHRVLASALSRTSFYFPKEDPMNERVTHPSSAQADSQPTAPGTWRALVATSGLPQAFQRDILERYADRAAAPEEIAAEIERARALWARLAEEGTVRGLGRPRPDHRPSVRGMLTSLDQVQIAFERLMGLPVPSEYLDIPRLSGIRELYHLVTGDREHHGMFRPENALLANATSSTMAELVRNVLNKRLMEEWTRLGQAGYTWWQRIVHEEDFSTLQQVSWIMVGGFGDLPTVAEGGSYTELAWDDKRETADWTKRGGYIGLTLEMIDRDDTARVRAIPRLLATVAVRTLSGTIAGLFTQNGGVGPTLSDGLALFHTSHGNLRTAALSSAEWDNVIQAMFKQAEWVSGKRLGARPRYLLVPIELEKTALQILGASQDPALTTAELDNVRRQAASDVIVVPEWTDANDWAAVADPAIAPGIGVGYRYGRTPEIFVAQDEVVGSMFTHDELRVKVRFLYAAGVMDYRPLHKNNVP
ncbi:MAG: hypothetical protein C4311_06375 [Chloroflexota bacterium]